MKKLLEFAGDVSLITVTIIIGYMFALGCVLPFLEQG